MNMKMYQKLFLSERIISTFHSHFIPFSLLSKFSIDILLPLNLKKKKAAKFKNEMLCHILHSYSLRPLGLPPERHCFLFIPNSLRPRFHLRPREEISQQRQRKAVLTGDPWHELQRPEHAHGPEGPQVHVCVEVGARGGQDAAEGDTEDRGYQGRAFFPCPVGGKLG